ncbi:reverse transcriptase [Tanacetum coccineum]|uniref:Reverse transcriptase n=1 Tax=Tanacetum coccineum TaxID=301880 RepID=A0ABQ4Z7S8_9ASTR
MKGWKQKLLSQSGREVLIKAVIQAIPTYAMQCFLLPSSLLNKLTAYVHRFFWGESIEHLLFESAWTRPVWFSSPLSFRPPQSGINIYDCIQSFIDTTHSVPDVSRILSVTTTTCWFIWRSCNNFVFKNVTPSSHNTLAAIYAQLNDHQKFVTHQSISSLTSAATKLDSTSHTSPQWIPPHDSSVKLNCDAAFKNSSAAFGIVARDSAGLLRYVTGNRCRVVSPLHAEIIAVHSACSLVFNHGWFNAIVESDSQIAISLSSLDTSPP